MAVAVRGRPSRRPTRGWPGAPAGRRARPPRRARRAPSGARSAAAWPPPAGRGSGGCASPATVPMAKPPRPSVTSHSREAASSSEPQVWRPMTHAGAATAGGRRSGLIEVMARLRRTGCGRGQPGRPRSGERVRAPGFASGSSAVPTTRSRRWRVTGLQRWAANASASNRPGRRAVQPVVVAGGDDHPAGEDRVGEDEPPPAAGADESPLRCPPAEPRRRGRRAWPRAARRCPCRSRRRRTGGRGAACPARPARGSSGVERPGSAG